MSLSGAERLALGCSMFDDARALAVAGLKADHPDASEKEVRRALLRRFYGQDFPPEKFKAIEAALGL
ncbi:MAG: hypothetical protein HY927_16580 [Elusimicrobia bacterium]|nr:hypothetical protein [Elusimicrobiota bacterium]